MQHPKPRLLLQQMQFWPLQQAQALCKTLGTEVSEEESKPWAVSHCAIARALVRIPSIYNSVI